MHRETVSVSYFEFATDSSIDSTNVHFVENVVYGYLLVIENKLYTLEVYPAIFKSLEQIDTERNLSGRIPYVCLNHLPALFMYLPRYLLSFYFAEFVQGVFKTTHFDVEWYGMAFQNATKFSNWLLAGMRSYNYHCKENADLLSMLSFLQNLARLMREAGKKCTAFASLKEEDFVTLTSIFKRYPDIIDTILSLLPNQSFQQEILIRVVVTTPSATALPYLNRLLEGND